MEYSYEDVNKVRISVVHRLAYSINMVPYPSLEHTVDIVPEPNLPHKRTRPVAASNCHHAAQVFGGSNKNNMSTYP